MSIDRMKHLALASIAFVLLFSGTAAPASERSKVVSSRGLIELHAGRYREALALFDEALADDAEDAVAYYYRAATHARMDNYERAIEDLKRALAIRPDFDEAALDVGVAYIETEQYTEALPWLIQAQRLPRLAARGSLFLGLAQLRLRRPDEARPNFERAAHDPEQYLTARYYEGVAAYQQADWAAAKQRFAEVAEKTPNSAMGKEANSFLAQIAEQRGRTYQLSLSTGLEYDSNVILAPASGGGDAESTLDVSQEADGAAIIAAAAGITPWQNDSIKLFLGYNFYQRLYFELHQFDVQDHGATAQVSGGNDWLEAGLASRYDYYLLETDSFLQEVLAAPWLSIAHGDFGRSDVAYHMRLRDYKSQSYRVRNGFNHAVGSHHLIYLGATDRYLSAGYQFDYEDPVVDDSLVKAGLFSRDSAESFGYLGHQFDATLGGELPADIFAELGYLYRHERYAKESADFIPSGKRRQDDQHGVVFSLRRNIVEHVDGVVAYLGDFNTSRDVRFDYNRHVVFVSMEVKL